MHGGQGMQLTTLPVLAKYRDKVSEMTMEGMKVVFHFHAPIIYNENPYLDNMLAWCVISENGLLGSLQRGLSYDLPTPLLTLWQSPDGLTLWGASCLGIDRESDRSDLVAVDNVYLHKRTERFDFNKKQPSASVGRFMDRRIPYESRIHKTLTAYCIGCIDEVARLLANVSSVGKRRNIAYGEIEKVTIEQIPLSPMDVIQYQGRLTRAIPKGYSDEVGLVMTDSPSLVGWTPPQWKPNLFSTGYPIGSTVKGVLQ